MLLSVSKCKHSQIPESTFCYVACGEGGLWQQIRYCSRADSGLLSPQWAEAIEYADRCRGIGRDDCANKVSEHGIIDQDWLLSVGMWQTQRVRGSEKAGWGQDTEVGSVWRAAGKRWSGKEFKQERETMAQGSCCGQCCGGGSLQEHWFRIKGFGKETQTQCSDGKGLGCSCARG